MLKSARTWLMLVGLLASFGFAQNQLVVVQGTEPQTLDLQFINAQVVVNIVDHISETLIDYDEQMALVPRLATSWEQIEPEIWRFHLRENVEFTNGEPFNASQVAFSLERVMDPGSGSMRQGQTRYISDIEIIDDLTIDLHTNGAVPLFDQYIASFPIVPSGYVTEVGDAEFALRPVGTGPFQLQEWVKDDHITLVRNPGFWGEPSTLDSIVFRSVPDTAARVATFLAGEADIVTDLPPTAVPQIESRPGLQVHSLPSMRIIFLLFNTGIESPVQNRLVRQALNFAVDKEAIVEFILDGYGKALDGQVVSQEYWGYDAATTAYPYDPDRARELLADAGYPEGFQLRIVSPRGRYMLDAEIAQAVAGQLREVGVDTEVSTLEWGVFSDEQYSKQGGPVFLLGYLTDPDAASMLSVFRSDHPNAQHADPAFDSLVDQAIAEQDPDLRRQLIHEAIAYFKEDAPVIFLHQQAILTGVSDRVSGFTIFPNGRVNVANVSINDDR